ncbi:MAG: S8 family peptidase [Bacteroidales bacterium]
MKCFNRLKTWVFRKLIPYGSVPRFRNIWFIVVLINLLALSSFSQEATLSSQTKKFMKDIRKYERLDDKAQTQIEKLKKFYPLGIVDGIVYIGGIIKVNDEIKESELEELGVQVNTKASKLWAVRIPVKKLEELAKIKGIVYIQTDTRVKKNLDNARNDASVGLVHSGSGLTQPYFGNGVIIGVTDFAFDYTHPTFYDVQGSSLRISRVWNTNDNSGNPPAGFSYGTEIIGQSDLINAGCSDNGGSHGTHVAGIAGGSGYSTEGKYVGVAPGAELVFVDIGGASGESGIVDAVNYIFSYGQSVGKPVVINMSLGKQLGPHDGTSLIDQMFGSLAGPGKILVGSAGNEGGTPLHTTCTFPHSGQYNPETLILFEDSQANTGEGLLEVYGLPNTSITLAVNVLDSYGNYVDYTDYLQSGNNPNISQNLSGVEVEITGEAANAYNQRPHFSVYVKNTDPSLFITLDLQDDYGTPNTIHIWNCGHGSNGAPLSNQFPGFGVIDGWLNGDTDYTVGEIGGTGSSVITVGAYTTKTEYVNLQGINQTIPFYALNGQIAPFSSHGPTLDGRTKPDVSGPGNVIISSVNSFDQNYGPNSDHVAYYLTNGTYYWYFAAMQGTSMSSPFVAGTIALMLEAKNNLSPYNIRTILYSTARSDNFTGTIPATGSNTWGAGKIDSYNSVYDAAYFSSISENVSGEELFAYPNPSYGDFSISLGPSNRPCVVNIYDTDGKIIHSSQTAKEVYTFDLESFPAGLYFLQVQQQGDVKRTKLMLLD